MPFPAAILWGAAAVVAAAGVKKGYDAHCDSERAKEIGEEAERKYKRAERALEGDRNETQRALENLGRVKLDAFTNQIKHLVEMHKKFKSKLSGYDEEIYLEHMKNVETLVNKSMEIEKGLGSGAVGAALATLGAYGSVGALATASTGTAIGTLSGAAATNATLAWLGGGSLAAGGFGMAGGMVALGGIALAPLLAIGGFWMASKAEEALTNAQRYSADVDEAVEKMKTVQMLMKGIRTSAAEQAVVIQEAASRFDQLRVYDMSNPEAFKRMMIIGKALKQIIDVPVLNKDGSANKNIRVQCKGYLELC